MSLLDYWGMLTNRPGTPFLQRLTLDGTPTGTWNANSDYSGLPMDFFVKPDDGLVYEITALKVLLTLKPQPNRQDYGDITAGLLNGWNLIFKRGTYENTLNCFPLKCNGDFILSNFERTITGFNGAEELSVFSTYFLREFGKPLPIHGDRDEQIIVRVNDNFTGLGVHGFLATGLRVAIPQDKQI